MSVQALFQSVGLVSRAPVSWGSPLEINEPGVYVVSLTNVPTSKNGTIPNAPLCCFELAGWLDRDPHVKVDKARATSDNLARRLALWWLPDEVVLYIGTSTRPLSKRVSEFYGTTLGARSPHAGGYFLKTLANLSSLWVYSSTCENRDPELVEDQMVRNFAASRQGKSPVLPFANLQFPKAPRNRKPHGISFTR